MEPINNLLPEVQSQQALTSYSTSLSKTLTAAESEIIGLKYRSQRFGKMKESDRLNWSMALLIKIHVITGWVVPDKQEYLNILNDQLQKKLSESYATVNADEVEYAFRNFGTSVKDWGKAMNLSMIDEVLAPYLQRRSELSKIEEDQKKELPAPAETLTDKTMQDWLNEVRLTIEKSSADMMPVMLYDWACEKGIIRLTTAEKMDWLAKAADYRLNQLQAANDPTAKDFARMKREGLIEGPEVDRLKNLAKKLILFNYLNNDRTDTAGAEVR